MITRSRPEVDLVIFYQETDDISTTLLLVSIGSMWSPMTMLIAYLMRVQKLKGETHDQHGEKWE
jgi:hypothetical protein